MNNNKLIKEECNPLRTLVHLLITSDIPTIQRLCLMSDEHLPVGVISVTSKETMSAFLKLGTISSLIASAISSKAFPFSKTKWLKITKVILAELPNIINVLFKNNKFRPKLNIRLFYILGKLIFKIFKSLRKVTADE